MGTHIYEIDDDIVKATGSTFDWNIFVLVIKMGGRYWQKIAENVHMHDSWAAAHRYYKKWLGEDDNKWVYEIYEDKGDRNAN